MTDDEIRSLASYALGQMLQKKASVEVAVRAVYRIATLKGHAHWRMWALLQLTTFKLNAPSEIGLKKAIDIAFEMFPDHDQSTALIENVRAQYTLSRQLDNNMLRTNGVASLEAHHKREEHAFESGQMQDVISLDQAVVILDRIKTQAQIYLALVEAGTVPSSEISE